MSKVLFIKASPLPNEVSRSSQVAETFIEEYKAKNPSDTIEELVLYNTEVPLLDLELMTAGRELQAGKAFTDLAPEVQNRLNTYNALTEQFLAADKYIFVFPLWNLGIPPLLKAYVDTFVVAGKSFRYTEHGPEPLLKNKKAILIHGSGGVYSAGQANSYTHGEPYLNTILQFIGIEVAPTIFVEGIDHNPSKEAEIVAAAKSVARESAAKF
ncbi:FMN-dependent NADH-azoreductase [Listeria immobilis]|uniref:FMN dependent NADH:quinone oxidoreductase n=1 Tax=Listeria immobilis TaxID=2713502 RepID=A0ABR6SS68_9LIST|nr:FMN-dependent NADH-azoreductase [Listeria immobilis]MBC1483318.1 FMN-dependent NADH-azoreductase [Listeria immobilis]MBC1505683.1 FMN-dependent NADH-azoreductase [Listeria immobilis]MBC1508526.1 FMN-dependent NADH-azoreductase [Listeria immobilis]MBC1514776.1 FMN-dependent NADH-azoreductase [Listeria immobilis]MBC6302045.1 FMN-dependent NADH-azoreductase [Listeria immobilis]